MLKRTLVVTCLALALGIASSADTLAQAHAPDETASFTGAWELTFGSQMGEMTWILTLSLEDGLLVGATESEMGTALVEGTQEGDQVDFTVFIDQPDHAVELIFTGRVEGHEASGNLDIMGEPFTWIGTRVEGG